MPILYAYRYASRIAKSLGATLLGTAIALVALGRGAGHAHTQFGTSSELLSNAHGQHDRYRAVGVFSGHMTCTAVLVAPPPTSAVLAETPAYVLTNGHCVSGAFRDAPNLILTDAPTTDGANVVFDVFHDVDPAQHRAVPAARIVYATMKTLDLAIVELAVPLSTLLEEGYAPLRLGLAPPEPGQKMDVISRPVDAPAEDRFLRRETCAAEAVVDLIEDGWHWANARRTTCADIVGGSSGSPLLNDDDRIVGLMHTKVHAGMQMLRWPCAPDVPCEVSHNGLESIPNRTYASPVDAAAPCFDETGSFDLGAAGCRLEPESRVQLSGYPRLFSNAPQWEVSVSGEGVIGYRYKFGLVTETRCSDPVGYSWPQSVQRPLTGEIPTVEGRTVDGRYALCVVAIWTSEQGYRWQSPARATIVSWLHDSAPPRVAFRLLHEPSSADERLEYTVVGNGDIMMRFETKYGPAGTVDCTDPSGYFAPHPMMPVVRAETDGQPLTLCAIGTDALGHRQAFEDATELTWSPPR